jgi:peptide methionine sulfoxide reductase msrA/msrB
LLAEIVFSAGCFWGVESHFSNINGVVDVKSGYTDGSYENPSYKQVLKYRNNTSLDKIKNHTEAVKVRFDNEEISERKLIESFWELHDPTQKNGQGNDIGNNYRSGIFYTTEKQKTIAIQTKEIYQKLLNKNNFGAIQTIIQPLVKFWDAEDFHQNYLQKNPNGYCPNHSTGVKFKHTNKSNTK